MVAPLPLADATDVRAFLAGARGEVAVVHLWATWCEPCLAELPRLQAAYESLTPWGVRFYTLAVDPPSNAEGVAAFVTSERLTFPVRVLREPSGPLSSALGATGLNGGLPVTFFYDRDGKLRHQVERITRPGELEALVVGLGGTSRRPRRRRSTGLGRAGAGAGGRPAAFAARRRRTSTTRPVGTVDRPCRAPPLRRVAPALLLVASALLAVACGDETGKGSSAVTPPTPEAPRPLVESVDPTIGSGGFGFAHGAAFVGATSPHGLVKLGPDTSGEYGRILFLHYSGYWFEDDTVEGFSHLHLHGTGATDYGVLSVMPVLAFDPAHPTVIAHAAKLDKASERAEAGRYAVTLQNGVRAELAATPRVGVHRYTFPAGTSPALLLDLTKHLEGGIVRDAELTLSEDGRSLRGRLHSLGAMSDGLGGIVVWFDARLSRPAASAQVWADGAPPAEGRHAQGDAIGALLSFPETGEPVELVVGISLVDAAGAAANLAAELPAGGLDEAAADARARWDAVLGRVQVEGLAGAPRRLFATSLYHAFLMPSLLGDVDGRYVQPDGSIATATTHRPLTELSLWDTYRTVHPLYALIAEESARDSAMTLLSWAERDGGTPRWPIGKGESGTMTGAPGDVVIADAILRGVPGLDAARAYELLRPAALDADPARRVLSRGAMGSYFELGYLAAPQGGCVSRTTEYAAADFALGNLAAHVGATDDAARLHERRLGYRALFDPETGFLRPHDAAGALLDDEPFDAKAWDDDAFTEANAWQSLWMPAAHDPDGFAALLGGREATVAKLTELFTLAEAEFAAIPPGDLTYLAFPRPYYWHGNEPDIHAAALFSQLGRPDLAQRWTRWIEDALYRATPDGLQGNDDGGTLGAWLALSYLGLYPLPGSELWILGAPRMARATIALPSGGTLVVEADGDPATSPYVAAVTLDGAPLDGPLLPHARLAAGGTLRFTLSETEATWGRAP